MLTEDIIAIKSKLELPPSCNCFVNTYHMKTSDKNSYAEWCFFICIFGNNNKDTEKGVWRVALIVLNNISVVHSKSSNSKPIKAHMPGMRIKIGPRRTDVNTTSLSILKISMPERARPNQPSRSDAEPTYTVTMKRYGERRGGRRGMDLICQHTAQFDHVT